MNDHTHATIPSWIVRIAYWRCPYCQNECKSRDDAPGPQVICTSCGTSYMVEWPVGAHEAIVRIVGEHDA